MKIELLILTFIYCVTIELRAGVTDGTQSKVPVADEAEFIAQVTSLNELLTKISFENVEFDFSMLEKKGDKNKDLKTDYWSSGKMLLSGKPNSLIKVHYFPKTTIWEDGTSPFLQEDETFAYNGKYWMTLSNMSGPINGMYPVKAAVITENCPDEWKSPRADTGEKFFITHADFYQNSTLKEFIQGILNAPKPLLELFYLKNVAIKREGAIESLLLALPSVDRPETSVEIFLDMAKGGALKGLRKRNWTTANPSWYEVEDVVEDYTRVREVWLPNKARRTFRDENETVVMEFQASNFKLFHNSGESYEIPLEPGTRVDDRRTRH